MSKVGHLQQLHETYGKRGFVMLGIADEEHPEHVSKAMQERKLTFPVGVDVRQRTVRGYATRGTLSLPRFYLVDVEGQVVSAGLPTTEEIEKQLARVMLPALGRELHAALGTAVAAYERGACGQAWLAAAKQSDSKDEALATDVAFLRAKVERYAAWQRARIEKKLRAASHVDAMEDLVVFESRFAGMGAVTWAKARMKELGKEQVIHTERFAWAKLRKALAKELRGVETSSKRQSARVAYKRILKQHAASRAAAIAADHLAALGDD